MPSDESVLVNTHEISSHVSAALSDASALHVLLGDFNIHHNNWGGMGVRPGCSSQLLLSLQELHSLSLLLPLETVTFLRHNTQSTIEHFFIFISFP